MPMARHRMKEGSSRGQWLALGGAVLVVLIFTFAVGVLVGRQSSGDPEPTAPAAPARAPAAPARRSGLANPVPERPAPREKLTFYQTLTAPLGATPASTSAGDASRTAVAKPRPPDRPAVPAAGPAHPARQERSPIPAGPMPRRPAAAGPGDWSVQVGAFRDRGQAESVRKPLAASGLDAYLIAVPADGGRVHYKVRVGAFSTRQDAARMAERLRQERSIAAFVTAR
jgi:cell division protein FtsN